MPPVSPSQCKEEGRRGGRFSPQTCSFSTLICALRLPHGYAKSKLMPTDRSDPKPTATDAARDKPNSPLSPAAKRALAEAAARRLERDRDRPQPANPAKEINGRGEPDPTRYGDWEIKGITSDF
jgi:hypothetical protein